MTHGRSDDEIIRDTHNTARFFVDNPHIAWVLLVTTCVAGLFAYSRMPKLKDPRFPIVYAAAVCPWPGMPADRVEQLITRRIEERIAENPRVVRIESTTRGSVAIVLFKIDEDTEDPAKDFDDIAQRLSTIRDLPEGAGPIEFMKDFGDTSALLLTVSSPRVDDVDLAVRTRSIREAIVGARGAAAAGSRVSVVAAFPRSIDAASPARQRDLMATAAQGVGLGRDFRRLDGPGFVGLDFETPLDDQVILSKVMTLVRERLVASQAHPDVWPLALVRDPDDTHARLAAVAGDKYSYRDLDRFTEIIKRSLQNVPQVAKVTRAGILPEQVYLEYSQSRLAALGLQPASLLQVLAGRNATVPAGLIEVEGRSLLIDPSGEFTSEREIGDVIVGRSTQGRPVYLRDSVDVVRGYQTPPRLLNYYLAQQADGSWRRARSITLSVQMRPDQQIAEFGAAVDEALAALGVAIPSDLQLARPSDQPLQVRENVDLFMRSLYEAIALVVIVALVGFWEWRSALVLALAIPITLAMTFVFMYALGIDLQQVSIASLIIALGLLVDDPVVAGDAIKRSLETGQLPKFAAWIGPTRLATAILFATITNIVAYLPFLMLSGGTGDFIYSLPVVLASALVASRITSMTFIPLLGYYLLRPSSRPAAAVDRTRGAAGMYYRVAGALIERRWATLGAATVLLAVGAFGVRDLKAQFFPKDLSYLSYVDVWLPEDATVSSSDEIAQRAEAVVRDVTDEYARAHGRDPATAPVLRSITSFVGGGGPRFWFSVSPELVQPNYAQLVINVVDKHDTAALVPLLQQRLSATIAGARIDVRQLETGKPVGIPVQVRLTGENIDVLRDLGEQAAAILRAVPQADRVRDDWGADSFKVRLTVDPDRANIAGVSNREVALSSATAMNGFPVTVLRDGDQRIPVLARLRAEERAGLPDIQNLYVYSLQSEARVPIGQVSRIEYGMSTEKIRRRNQFRTLTVAAFPVPGALPSEVLGTARPALDELARRVPPGYRLEIGGEQEEQQKGFGELALVMLISVVSIYLALVFQFRNAVKPWIVFSAIPFGVMGALVSLVVMGAPFGFMAFLGVASLVGVIVSHVIVLFDYIEEAHQKGEPLREALLDAGLARLRPVVVTVGATVFGLIPLALHGGPLWEGLCYTQIGGLTMATLVTLILVPVLYAIFVLDLRLVRWDPPLAAEGAHPTATGA
ncbi:MAG: efflux RND transporter permease subunit [Acidobacteria bacterium]|nr:efflux RND transporter permease subunit [Acidobacteriota bacterium]